MKQLVQVYEGLQKLIGLHRQLLDTVRMEHEALVQSNIKDIQDAVFAKEALIEVIRHTEALRLKSIEELSFHWKKPAKELTLSAIIIIVQGTNLKAAEQLRSALNTLTILAKRIQEQNSDNQILVQNGLEHVIEMKANSLSAHPASSNTYTQSGQKASTSGAVTSARLLSREA